MPLNLNKVPKAKSAYKPYEVNITEDQKKDFELWLSTRLDEVVTASASRIEKIKTLRDGYEGAQYQREAAFENGANVRIPIAPIMMEAILLRLVQSHFGVKPYIRITPKPEGTIADEARGIENMLWYVHYNQNKLRTGYLVVRDALLTGTGISKTTWEQEWKLVRDGRKRKYVLRKSLPSHDHIKTEDFVIYPMVARDVDSAQFVGHRFTRRWDELVRGAAVGLYNADWLAQIENKTTAETLNNTQTRQSLNTVATTWKDQPFELYELIVGYDLDGDGLDEDYWVVIDKQSKTIIRLLEYPAGYGERWYHVYAPKPTGEGIYGESTYEQAVAFDEEITTLHNARLDNNALVNIPAFTVREGSPAARDSKRRVKPGEKILVTEHDDIKPLVQIPPLHDTGPMEDRLLYYAQLRIGVSELNLGQTPRGEKTAYEIEASLAEGSIRIRLEVELGIQWLKRIAWHELGLMKDFLPDEVYERVTQQINPLNDLPWEDLWSNYDLEAIGNSTTSNRELERQKLVFVTESMKNDPLVMQIETDPMTGQPVPKPTIGWYNLRKRFLLAHGIDDYQEIIGAEPQEQVEEEISEPQGMTPDILGALAGAMPTGATMSNMPSPQEMSLSVANPDISGTVPGAI